jgi:hypothetical protein
LARDFRAESVLTSRNQIAEAATCAVPFRDALVAGGMTVVRRRLCVYFAERQHGKLGVKACF